MMNASFCTKTIAYSALLFGALSGRAEASNNHFDELLSLYDMGTEVNFDDVKGGWSGRCFVRTNPNTPYAAILLSAENEDSGPAFPPAEYLSIFGYGNVSPSYFDNYNANLDPEAGRHHILRTAANKRVTQASATNGTLSWTLDFEPNNKIDIKFSVRRHSDFIIVRGENLISGNTLYSSLTQSMVSNVEVGIWNACYFFKNLHGQ